MKPDRRAVFFDRDGVITRLIFNPETGEHESPHVLEDLEFHEYALDAMKKLSDAGYSLFLVSNQPSYAKRKTTLEEIKRIASEVDRVLCKKGLEVKPYYCFHHPDGVVPEYSFACECRKPKPYFILKARDEFALNLTKSWMIGDRDSDIECGKAANCLTIQVMNPLSVNKQGRSVPDFKAKDLKEAVSLVLNTI